MRVGKRARRPGAAPLPRQQLPARARAAEEELAGRLQAGKELAALTAVDVRTAVQHDELRRAR